MRIFEYQGKELFKNYGIPVPQGVVIDEKREIGRIFPDVAEFNLLANPEKFARVSEVMGENITGLTTLEAGRKGIETIRQLNIDLGIPSRLRDLGVKED